MTDEQVKQNADNYTESLMCENLHRTMYSSIDFIAGAHSRDEEIEQLEERIKVLDMNLVEQQLENQQLRNDNKDLEQALACAEDVVDIQRKELDQLRNPWISVEERMPEKSNENKNYSVNCIVRYTDEYLFPGQVFYTEAYYDYGYEKKSPYNKGGWMATYNDDEHFFFSDYEEYGCVVTHWMPIPELKKGE